MKKTIKQALLHYGGYKTVRKINAKLENYSLVKRYLTFLETGHAPLPDKVIFEPTLRCNLNCKMCFQKQARMENADEISLEQIKDFFESAPFLKKATLIGGEIFMRCDMIDLIKHLNSRHDIVICTNGTCLNETELDVFKVCNRIYTVCISLDGPKEIHESIRGIKGSYDCTVNAIKILSRILPVTVNLVIQDENIRFIPAIVDLCASLGAKKVKIEMERIYSAERRAAVAPETGIAPSKIPVSSNSRVRSYSCETLHDTLLQSLERGRKTGMDVFIDPPYLMDNLRACYENRLLTTERYICHLMNTATIAPNGDVINCIHIRKVFGNILDKSFDEIWDSEEANEFRKYLLQHNLTPLCENCPFMRPAPLAILNKIEHRTNFLDFVSGN